MRKFLLSLTTAVIVFQLYAESPAPNYAEYGKLITVKLDTAPFPHPDRAQGHTYGKKVFSAEKNYSDNTVAIFIPKGFRRTDKVDFVVHFHGWGNYVQRVLSQYHLVQQFAEAGRNAILVVPQGPYDAQDSFDGKLEDENGFKRFMADVMATLQQDDIIRTKTIGSIVLSGHSGGYEVISSILARGGLNDNIKEVYLFDALYGRTEKFMNWFDHYRGRRMVNIYTEHGGTKEETEKLIADTKARKDSVSYVAKNEADITRSDLKNKQLIFIYTPMEHDHTPHEHESFRKFLETSRLAPLKLYSSPRMSEQ